jgi:DNA-binding transcriptional LysR family regulator
VSAFFDKSIMLYAQEGGDRGPVPPGAVSLSRTLRSRLAVNAGRLKLLLRPFEAPPLPVSLVSPDARLMPQKLKAFMDFVGPRLKARLIFNS